MRLIQYILFITIFLSSATVSTAQTSPIKKSKNKVIVGGKTYLLHIVEPKQTLYAICKAYNVDMAKIMHLNNKKTTNLDVNDAIRIPLGIHPNTSQPEYSGEYILHTVKKGDTLFSLHKKYGVPIADIIKNNPETEHTLSLDSVIKIPRIKEQIKEPELPHNYYDNKYYYYIVKPKDTRYGIAKKFGLKYRKLRRYNRFLKKRDIQPGDKIKIPLKYVSKSFLEKIDAQKEKQKKEEQEVTIKPTDIVTTDDKTTTDQEETSVDLPIIDKKNMEVALFLPLYLNTNDTINRTITIENNTAIKTERNPRIIYRKTKNFLRFYQGVLAAVDSLNQQGYNINLSVFDTENNPKKVRNTLSQMQTTPFDFIIGPVYPRTFAAAAQFAKLHQIPIISPLSVKDSGIKNNSYVVQLNASINAVSNGLAHYVTSKVDTANIVVLYTKKQTKTEEYTLVEDIQNQLFKQGRYWNSNQLNYQKLDYETNGLNELSKVLRDSCENIVIVPSNDQPTVERYITELNILQQQFDIRVVGFPKWQRFNSLELDLFYNLNLTLLSPYFINYNTPKIDNFTTNFRNKFKCEPNDFSFRGYDAMLFFSKAAGKYGKQFLSAINTVKVDLLQADYNLKKIGENGGYENQGFFLINYNKNYSIKHRCNR